MTTILDDFEDGDISEYGGDTGDFSVTTNNPYEGSNSIEPVSDIRAEIVELNQQINDNEVPFGCWVNPGLSTSGSFQQFWMINLIWSQSGDDGGYSVVCNVKDDVFTFYQYNDDETRTQLAQTNQTFSTDTWYRIAVTEYDSNGNMTARVYDTSNTELASLSVQDSTFDTNLFGIVHDRPFTNDVNVPHCDKLYKLKIPEPPTGASATVQ